MRAPGVVNGEDANGAREVPTHSVKLTDDELTLLDGRCSEKVQKEVDAAKARLGSMAAHPDLPPAQAALIADVVNEARETGRLIYRTERIDYCRICKQTKGHVPFKSGPRKGKPNYDRPIRMTGYEFARRFVIIRGSITVGGCQECVEAVMPYLPDALRGVAAEVPAALRAKGEPIRKRYDRRRCTKCGWEGHEGEMGQLRTLMGDGYYPGKCPSCGVEHLPFTTGTFETLDGFVIVDDVSRETATVPNGSLVPETS